nr:histidine kinase [uncultured Sphaerochaeta sp.]
MASPEIFRSHVKQSWYRMLIYSLSALVSIILVVSWFWVQRSTVQLLRNNEQFLQVYTDNLQKTIFSPIEKAATRVQLLLRFQQEKDHDLDFVQELFDLRLTSASLDRAWMIASDGTTYYAPNVNKAVTEQNPWWKVYLSEEKRSMFKVLGSRGFGSFGFEVAPSFRDDMDLSTILPVVYWYIGEDGRVAFAFLEFNLTSLLIQHMNAYKVELGDTPTPIEVLIYDSEGMVLESSRNIPLQILSMPTMGEDSQLLGSIDLSDGMVFTREESYISLFSRNTPLALTFSTKIPWSTIVSQSRKNYLFVLLLAGLFSLVFLVLMVVYVRLHANMRRYEAMQAESRFEALQARMNPHFLFNTLDSLVSVVEEGDKRRSLDTLRSLSYILHVDLREKRNEIPLLSEIRYIRNYVNLQEIRYKDLFTFSLDIDDSVPDDIRILKYCIQPLVENCFVHGVYLRQMTIFIEVKMFFDEKGLHVNVSDNGPGCGREAFAGLQHQMETDPQRSFQEKLHLRGKHIGLFNIHQRIFYAYGPGFGLTLKMRERGFSVEVLLPAVYQKELEA